MSEFGKGIQKDRQRAAAEKAAREATRQASGKPSGMDRLGQAASWLGRKTLIPGVSILGADLLSGGLTGGLGQGASSELMRDTLKLIGQGQKLGPAYKDLKQNVRGTVSPEQEKPKEKPKPAPVILTPSKYKMPVLPQ